MRSLRVLLVEDDVTVAEVVRGLLAGQGHEVTHAAQGLAALAAVATQEFDIALIDLDLPGVDGLALARMLRRHERQAGAARRALIGISARSTGAEDAQCREAGMDGFLRKPLSGEQLARALSVVTSRA
jgi:CheY-like chemotaxis protein